MQVLVENKVENKSDGMLALMGKRVILFCGNYFYAGKLVGVNKALVKLEEPSIVYETGPLTEAKWKEAQRLHADVLYVRVPAIEAYCEGK